ncbi:MAG: hypothetical protein LAT63_15935 [Marinobacter sp.]|nr:hypothetical protein [Marinobacter sp.]
MCLDAPLYQRGAGLPVALFVITVLALIVAGMAQLQVSTAESVTLQLQSQRAFLAAESGAQLGVRAVLAAENCGAVPANVPGSGTFAPPGLSGCRAALVCDQVTLEPEPGVFQRYYLIASTGQCGTGAGLVARTVEVRVQ